MLKMWYDPLSGCVCRLSHDNKALLAYGVAYEEGIGLFDVVIPRV